MSVGHISDPKERREARNCWLTKHDGEIAIAGSTLSLLKKVLGS